MSYDVGRAGDMASWVRIFRLASVGQHAEHIAGMGICHITDQKPVFARLVRHVAYEATAAAETAEGFINRDALRRTVVNPEETVEVFEDFPDCCKLVYLFPLVPRLRPASRGRRTV